MRIITLLALASVLFGVDSGEVAKQEQARHDYAKEIKEGALYQRGFEDVAAAKARFAKSICAQYLKLCESPVPVPDVGKDARPSEQQRANLARGYNGRIAKARGRMNAFLKSGDGADDVISLLSDDIPGVLGYRDALGLPAFAAPRETVDVLGNEKEKPKLRATLADGTVIEQ